MAVITVAAILRTGIYSPNHIANDAAILHSVVGELRRRGCLVNVYSEEEFCDAIIKEDVILAMCRNSRTVEKIQHLEDAGRLVVNSGYGIENCIRMIMIHLLAQAGIPVPEFLVVDTDVDVRKQLQQAGLGSCWVKKGDAPVHHLEDIARCRHSEEAQEILHEFFFRHISKAVISKDIEGEKIRCYGVASSGWFHSFMPFRSGTFEEEGNALPEPLFERVKDICMKAAHALNVDIFGCDIVLDSTNECYLVSFDDWPSFAPIRKDASRAIAKSVLSQARRAASKK